MRVDKCPVCGSAESAATGPEAPPIHVPLEIETFEQPSYYIRECSGCGLLYRDCTLSAEEFARYYSVVDPSRWELAGYHPTEDAVLSKLQELPARSRILDFGCSSGRLLAGLADAHRCFGIEINRGAARVAAAKGLTILTLPQLEDEDSMHFDAIVLVDVFEHLTDPVGLLRTLTRTLAPGGSLMIVTGDGDAPACRRDPGQFWYFRNLEHVAMLTRRSAEFIAAELSLRLMHWSNLSHYDLTAREKLVQKAQTFAYWQYRKRTLLSRFMKLLPLFGRLRRADVAPSYTCSRDHVLAVFRR